MSAVNESRDWKVNLRKGGSWLRQWVAGQLAPQPVKVDRRQLSRMFLRLGATGFGGGIAVIAQIRRVVVTEQRWLSEMEFLDAVSLAQSLPGASAANAVTYIGLKLAGLRGALVSIGSFILPSFLMMIGLTVAHDYLSQAADAQRVFQGFNAAVVGLIAATTVKLGKTAMQRQWHLELGVAVGFMLVFTETTVAEVVLLAGLTAVFIQSFKNRARHRVRQRLRKKRESVLGEGYEAEEEAEDPAEQEGVKPAAAAGDDTESEGPVQLRLLSCTLPLVALLFSWPFLEKFVLVWKLMTIFLRVGTVTFGGGFVMIPQIETDIVNVHGWLTHQTFADGMAFGQLTPGPVLITATFIGYKVAGLTGAVAATISAFLPSFVMTAVAGTSLNRFRANTQVQAFLAGVAPAVVGMLAAAGVSLAKAGLNTPLSYGVATLAFLLMMRARFNPVVIIAGCGILQWLLSRGFVG